MADPLTAKFGKFRILLGDGASPEVFAAPCGFTSKAITWTKGLTEINLPDCIDPDAPASVGRDVENLSVSVNGEGVLAAESIDEWILMQEAVVATNVRIEIDIGIFTHTWNGGMLMGEMGINAEQGGRCTITVNMSSDGTMIHTVAST